MSMSMIGYVMAIIVNGKPVLFWRQWEEDVDGPRGDKRGAWTKSPQEATRSYSHESIMAKYDDAMQGGHTPCTGIVVIEDRVVTSVMTESEFERRRLRRIKLEPAD